jgi:hypothetical protein
LGISSKGKLVLLYYDVISKNVNFANSTKFGTISYENASDFLTDMPVFMLFASDSL